MHSGGFAKLADKQTPAVPRGVWTLQRTRSSPALLERVPSKKRPPPTCCVQ